MEDKWGALGLFCRQAFAAQSSSFLVVTEQILDLFQGARAVFVSAFIRGEVVPEAATELQ